MNPFLKKLGAFIILALIALFLCFVFFTPQAKAEENLAEKNLRVADSVWEKLVEAGVGVRKFPGSALLENQLRITEPTSVADYLQLATGICNATGTDPELAKARVADLKPQPVDQPTGTGRTASTNRETKETKIDIELKNL